MVPAKMVAGLRHIGPVAILPRLPAPHGIAPAPGTLGIPGIVGEQPKSNYIRMKSSGVIRL